MATETFINKRFNAKHRAIIDTANTILRRYGAQGYDLSLRQLYYQFVAHHGLENKEQSYKLLGNVISDARDAGLIDWGSLVDRGRIPHILRKWDDPADMLRWSAEQYRIERWDNQPCYVEVMVEKQALEGVLIPVCEEWHVPFSANKGYSSASALYRAGKRIERALYHGKDIRVVYLGDHDPSGMDMTRDVRERLQLYAGWAAGRHGTDVTFEVFRVALNMNQIDQYAPPPNPAKMTDSRAAGYVDSFGDESWELDALDPSILADLVSDAIREVVDEDAWSEREADEESGREYLTTNADEYEANN